MECNLIIAKLRSKRLWRSKRIDGESFASFAFDSKAFLFAKFTSVKSQIISTSFYWLDCCKTAAMSYLLGISRWLCLCSKRRLTSGGTFRALSDDAPKMWPAMMISLMRKVLTIKIFCETCGESTCSLQQQQIKERGKTQEDLTENFEYKRTIIN